MEQRNEISTYLENISLVLLGILFLGFPLIFTSITTDAFSLPKQIILAVTVLVLMLLWSAKMIIEGTVRIRRTPFDLPLFLFGLVTLISTFLSVNRFDALISYMPFLFGILSFYIIVQVVRSEPAALFLLSAFLGGAALVALVAVLSFFKVYILPFPFTRVETFNTFGATLDQAMYLALAVIVGFHFAFPRIKKADSMSNIEIGFVAASIITLFGLVLSIFQLFTSQKPLLLTYETGFQTAFAAISQDAGRVLVGFLFGSGYGTYITDFTRFKQATFNLNDSLWQFTFFRSSSFILELLATTGFLGVATFLFLVVKAIRGSITNKSTHRNPVFLALLLLFALSFLLPFSFTIQTMMFFLLALFAAIQGIRNHHDYSEIEIYFVALQKGLLAATPAEEPVRHRQHSLSKFLPVSLFAFTAIFVGAAGFFTYKYVASDILFQNSLVAASNNKGLDTYNGQISSIQMFPWRDAYHRIYSQTNLALANSLAGSIPQGSSPSAQTQQIILQLIQQSINAGRTATIMSPMNSINWQNLSSIYRSLIGFGQNAADFAILTDQQAIALDPSNPQAFLNLGGVYYQMQQWAEAQRQFQLAVNLKPDFGNAHYNLGHALEMQGDFKNAIAQYQIVRSLVANESESVKKIDQEIAAVQDKLGKQQQVAGAQTQQNSLQNQPPLGINTPEAKLPQQKEEIKIPPPPTASESGQSATPTPGRRANPRQQL